MKKLIGAPVLAILLAAAPLVLPSAALAGSDMTGMPGMPGGTMHGMTMQQMDQACARMQAQMKPGMTMSPKMQAMMASCAEMQKKMGARQTPQPGQGSLSR